MEWGEEVGEFLVGGGVREAKLDLDFHGAVWLPRKNRKREGRVSTSFPATKRSLSCILVVFEWQWWKVRMIVTHLSLLSDGLTDKASEKKIKIIDVYSNKKFTYLKLKKKKKNLI